MSLSHRREGYPAFERNEGDNVGERASHRARTSSPEVANDQVERVHATMTDVSQIESALHASHEGSAGAAEQADPYALQGSASTSVEKITLKHGDAFLVADARGDLPESEQETGLYWRGTRFLRTCDIFLTGQPLIPLSHSISDEEGACQIDLTNPYLRQAGESVYQGDGARAPPCSYLRNNVLDPAHPAHQLPLEPIALQARRQGERRLPRHLRGARPGARPSRYAAYRRTWPARVSPSRMTDSTMSVGSPR